MIYRLHHNAHPFDPHRTTYASLDEFHEVNGAFSEHTSVIHAYDEMCKRWPDAVFMPATVRIGSGSPVLLGVLRNIADHGGAATGEIPFVAWVRAEAQTPMDQKLIRKGNPFDRKFWRTPVRRWPAMGAVVVKSELRASDLETPSPGQATIWKDGDQLVVHLEVGGGEISISLEASAARRVLQGSDGKFSD